LKEPLQSLLRRKGRPLLLLAESGAAVAGLLVGRGEGEWEPLGEAVSLPASDPGAIETLLATLAPGKGAGVVLASVRCGLVAHPSAVPAGLDRDSAAEMLRWEVDLAALSPSGSAETPPADWKLGHAPAGEGRCAVAAVAAADLDRWREALAARSIDLDLVVPAAALGYALLDRSIRRSEAVVAVATRWEGEQWLAIFERGRLEFHAPYASPPLGWARGLVADARSFAPERLVGAGQWTPAETAGEEFRPPSLPAPEWIRGDGDWPWSGLLAFLELSLADANEPFPAVVPRPGAPALWRHPALWWATAASVLAAVALPLMLAWTAETGRLLAEGERFRSLAENAAVRLASLEAETEEFGRLQKERRELEDRIAAAERRRDRPAASPCASIDYLSASLRALSQAFVGPVRLLRFQTDFEGRLAFAGETDADASAQEAAGRFFAAMEGHPIRPSPLSTTRDGAPPGRFLFLAEDPVFAAAAALVEATPAEAETIGEIAPDLAASEEPAGESADEEPPPVTASLP
jgi:hypothetical protein